MSAEKRCSSCKKASYCSRGHQVEHWKSGHKEECKGQKAASIPQEELVERETKRFASILFEEWQLVTEEEEEAPEDLYDDDEEAEAEEKKKKLRKNLVELEEVKKKLEEEKGAKGEDQNKADIPDEEFAQEHLEAKLDVDDAFIKFQCHTEKKPEQCLRYCSLVALSFC